MDNEKAYYSAYQNANATTSHVEQLIMLYDGAINFIKQAKEAINEKDWEKRYNLINKAIAIVGGLNSCLDFNDKTEETAQALDDFYREIDMRLLYIQCDNNLESCDSVINDLITMRDAWVGAAKEVEDIEKASGEEIKAEQLQSEEESEDSDSTEEVLSEQTQDDGFKTYTPPSEPSSGQYNIPKDIEITV